MIPGLLSSLSLLLSYLLEEDLTPTPTLCIHSSSTLEQLTSCLDEFVINAHEFDAVSYQLAQPTPLQREAWADTVTSLLHVDGDCSSVPIPESLEDIYTIETFTESGRRNGREYCVLVETSVSCSLTFLKGWGYMIVPSTRAAVSRDIHISAPHPWFDLGTVVQATSLFKSTGARTLLVPGRQRAAYYSPTDCVQPTNSKTVYYMTDPTHSTAEPFFDASIAIYNWQQQHTTGGCSTTSCAFIQFHGKSASTCPYDQIFISSGLDGQSTSREWYNDPIDRPVKRLKAALSDAFPPWNVSLPSDTACALTATKNVLGRHMNGVPISDVCSTAAQATDAKGEFVHIEQAAVSRDPKYFDTWSRVLRDVFATSCAPGMRMDPMTKLCVVSRVGGEQAYMQMLSPSLLERTYFVNVLMRFL